MRIGKVSVREDESLNALEARRKLRRKTCADTSVRGLQKTMKASKGSARGGAFLPLQTALGAFSDNTPVGKAVLVAFKALFVKKFPKSVNQRNAVMNVRL